MGFACRVKGCLLSAVVIASGLSGQESPPKRSEEPRSEAPELRLFDGRDLTCAFPKF